MQRHVVSALNDPSLAVDVIWTPVLRSDRGIPPDARKRLPDARVRHWWDRDRWAQQAFRDALKLPAGTPAWDVYLVYPPGTRWTGTAPPVPTFFMHQLRVLGEQGQLHGPTLKSAVAAALGRDATKDAIESACTLSADTLSQRKPVVQELLAGARTARRTADGVVLEFDRTREWRRRLEDFVSFERRCCSHLGFAVNERRRERRLELVVTARDSAARAALWKRLENRLIR